MIAESLGRSLKLRFVFAGFTQESGVRVFAFEKIAEDQTRTKYSVRADLALSRRYDIRMQELPLLCRVFLERQGAEEDRRAFTLTEQEMSIWAKESAAKLRFPSFKKRPPVNPPGEGAGAVPSFRVP